MGLYDDLAILIRGKNPSFLIARVVRIRNKVPSGKLIEYKQPIFVTDFDKYSDSHVLVRKYTPMDDQIFKLGDEFLASFLLKDVISPVALTYDVDSDQYVLSDSDLQAIKSCVSACDRFHFYLIYNVLSHAGLYNPASCSVGKAVDIF